MRQTEKQILWLSGALLGGVIGALGGLLVLLAVFVPPLRAAGLAVTLAGIGLWLVVLGAALLWAGETAYRGYPGLRIHASKIILWAVGLGGMLLVLILLLPEQAQTSPLFALIHLGALVLPGVILLLVIIWSGGAALAPTVRQIVLAFSGGVLSLAIALPVEVIGLVLSGLVVAGCALLIPGGSAELHHLADSFQQWQTSSPGLDDVVAMMSSPIVWGVFALTLAVITPLIEELVKPLVAAVVIWQARPSLPYAFVWGAACGVGFSILEGVSNSSFGLGHTGQWGGGLLFRSLATLMHAFTGGLVGVGWGMARNGRWWAYPLLYLAAAGLHGLWNLTVLLMLLGGVGTGLAGLFSVTGMGVLGMLILISGVGNVVLPWALRRMGVTGLESG